VRDDGGLVRGGALASARVRTYDPFVTDAAKKLLEQFDALSDDDQRWLVDALLDRVGDADDDELSDEWKAELAERIGEIERGEVELVDADTIADELRERYG
jgi:putative addiction module component (TIGR02574 family)